MTTNKYINLKNKAYFKVEGYNKDTFLQGLITNDINKCSENKAIYSAFLSPQGKFIADFFIINLGESFLFEIDFKYIEEILNKFNMYKLKEKITITPVLGLSSIVIYKNNNLFSELKNEGQLKKTNYGYIFLDPRNIKMGLKIIIKSNFLKKFCKKNILEQGLYSDYEEIRIRNTIPDSITDLEINKSLLLENNFESINSLDWDKGCYIGQEITARMKYRSLLKKSLTKIIIVKGVIKAGEDIFFE